MSVTDLALDRLRMDGGTQSRAELNTDQIGEYAELYSARAAMPPIVVFYDGEIYWLADGFHRVKGARKAGRAKIKADIRQGSQRDAVLYSVGANSDHGLPRTNADKRRAVETLLRDDEWVKRSDSWIADKCKVSHPFVGRVRSQLVTVTGSQPARTGKDGKARKVPERKTNAVPLAKPPSQTRHLSVVPSAAEEQYRPINDDDLRRAAGSESAVSEAREPEDEPDEQTALIELNADLRRHLDAWSWSIEQFVATLNTWIYRARTRANEDASGKS